MTLEKIHIKNRGTLVDFKAEFGPITVIYGPNASGKSLLSNTLRSIEREKWIGPGEAEVTINGRTLRSEDFAQGEHKDRIRVFNADFLRDDVIDGGRGAIVLGSEVQEQRMEINRISDQVSHLVSQKEQVSEKLQSTQEALGEKHQAAGELVRTVLRTVPKVKGANPRWPGYNRRDARDCYERMMQDNSAPRHYTTSDELETLAQTIRQRPSNLLNLVHVDDPRIADLHKRATALLQKIPNAGSLPEADNDPGRRDWLLKGHGYASSQEHCAYCLQVVPPDRAEILDSYFSDDMTKLLSGIKDLILDIDRQAQALRKDPPPSVDEVRSDLQGNYRKIRERSCNNVGTAISALATIKSRLMSKKESPNLVVEVGVEPPDWDSEATDEVNQVIKAHNESVDDLLKFCYKYELGAIANQFDEWKGVEDQITDLKSQIKANNQQITEKTMKLDALRRSADTKLIAADELTDMVSNFIGHDEIGFKLNANDDHSYQLTRHGVPASGFSEGERTALALMYFLKRLEDDSFDKRNGTLVFDDPITSFDEDNLYRAVADIVTRTGIKDEAHDLKACKIVIMTHHFGLFERLWMELRNKRDKGDAEFYEICYQFVGSRRVSKLVPLKNMLATDYMLAFYEVQSMADGCETVNNPETSLRKCVEGFITRMAPGAIDQGLSSAYWSFVNRHKQVTVRKEDLQFIISIANGGSHLSAVSQRAGSDRHWSTLQATSTNFLQLMSDAAPQHYGDLKTWYSRRVKQEALLKVESGT